MPGAKSRSISYQPCLVQESKETPRLEFFHQFGYTGFPMTCGQQGQIKYEEDNIVQIILDNGVSFEALRPNTVR